MERDSVEEFQFITSGVGITALANLGTIGNVVSLIILSRPQMRSSINCCLQGLALFDTLVLTCSLLMFGLPSLAIKAECLQEYSQQLYPLMVPILYPFALIAQTGSVWTTVGVTMERYVAVCHPLRARSLCTYRRARFCNIFVIVFSVCYNLPRFWEVKVAEYTDSENRTKLAPVPTLLRQDKTYFEVYYVWFYLLVMYFVPFLTLAIFNGFIWRTVRSANRNRQALGRKLEKEINLALMLLCVVIVFFLCNLLALVANVLEYFDLFLPPLVHFSNFLVTFNSSVNFVIYCIFGRKFRRMLLKIFCGCPLRSSRRETQNEQVDVWVRFHNGKASPRSSVMSTNETASVCTKM